MLTIRVDFLTQRYCATAHNDRTSGEWPPHPARLMAACIAAWGQNDPLQAEELEVLKMFEDAGAPEIRASDAGERTLVTNFVPVNDTRLARQHDKQFEALIAAEEAIAESDSTVKAQKAWDKALTNARSMTERESSPKASEGTAAIESAAGLLPEGRPKQGRHFPTLIPDDPTVWFTWPDLELEGDHRRHLDRVLARVARLGHSSSLVSCSLAPSAPEATHVPEDDGDATLRVIRPGVIDRWIKDHAAAATDSRVLVTATSRYRHVGGDGEAQEHAALPEPLLAGEWFVFQRVGRTQLRSSQGLVLASSFKDALMSHAPEATELLSGHVPRKRGSIETTKPTTRPHLACVPLPFVGSPHADGAVLGIAAICPTGTSPDELAPLLGAIGAWEASRGDDPVVVRIPGGVGIELRRVTSRPALANLRRSTWCRPAKRWVSATPVALDRVPGNLFSREPSKRAAAYRAAEEVVRRSCERAGLPVPDDVEIMHGSPLAGVDPVRRFAAYRRGSQQRVLVHASLEFASPVLGPVLIGAGRFFGYGLFRPLVPGADGG